MHAAFPFWETSSSLPELYNKKEKGSQHLLLKGFVPLMHSSAQAWPLHLTASCYLRAPPVNLIVLPLLALSVQKVCKTDKGRVSIVWSMKSNTKEFNSASVVKLLVLIRGLMLLAPSFPPTLHSQVHWLSACLWGRRWLVLEPHPSCWRLKLQTKLQKNWAAEQEFS